MLPGPRECRPAAGGGRDGVAATSPVRRHHLRVQPSHAWLLPAHTGRPQELVPGGHALQPHGTPAAPHPPCPALAGRAGDAPPQPSVPPEGCGRSPSAQRRLGLRLLTGPCAGQGALWTRPQSPQGRRVGPAGRWQELLRLLSFAAEEDPPPWPWLGPRVFGLWRRLWAGRTWPWPGGRWRGQGRLPGPVGLLVLVFCQRPPLVPTCGCFAPSVIQQDEATVLGDVTCTQSRAPITLG